MSRYEAASPTTLDHWKSVLKFFFNLTSFWPYSNDANLLQIRVVVEVVENSSHGPEVAVSNPS